MEKFYNAAVLWFIAGFVFFLLEFAVPGLILFFFAVERMRPVQASTMVLNPPKIMRLASNGIF